MPSFNDDHLYLTTDPLIYGLIFLTRGPKRDYRLLRLRNGVSILVDPESYEVFGLGINEDKIERGGLRLPLKVWFLFDD